MKLSDFVNVDMAIEPYNWAIVTLMALLGALVLFLFFGPDSYA